jgi:hypothetical protein
MNQIGPLTVMEYLINIANALYLFSYFVRDMLSLRVLSVIAASCLILYFYFGPEPLMVVVYWNLFFIALNVYWVVRPVFERRGHLKTGEENGLTPASSPSRALTDVQCCLC